MQAFFLALALMGPNWTRWKYTIAVLLATHLLYAAAVWRGRPGRGWAAVVIPALLFRLTLAPLAPFLSDDLHRYRWEGKIQAGGLNPYFTAPADVGAGAPVPVPEARSVYGPLTELAEGGVWRLASHFEREPGILWFKLPAAAADLGIMALLIWRAPAGAAIYAWNPLPVVEFWGNGHNDALPALGVLAAVLLTCPKWIAFALGAAAAAKLWPAMLVPVLVRPIRYWPVAAIVPVFASFPYWPQDWPQVIPNIRFSTGFLSGWRNQDSLYGLILWIVGDVHLAKKIVIILIGFVALWLRQRPWPPERRAMAAVVALLALSANAHPWYLAWLLPLAALWPWPPVLVWAALSPLLYWHLAEWKLHGEWVHVSSVRWLVYAPVLACMIAAWARRRLSFTAKRDA
jgi:hypothetical protein